MKKKQVLALMLAATMVTALPIQAFAADQSTSPSITEEKNVTGPTEMVEHNYEGSNFIGQIIEDPSYPGKASLDVDVKKGSSNTTDFTFPSKVTVNGKTYEITNVIFWPSICKSAKKITLEEGIENFNLSPSMMNLDEVTLPSTIQRISAFSWTKDNLPSGEPCILLDGVIKKVNFTENDWIGYDKEIHAFYEKFHGSKLELRNLMVKAEGEAVKTDKYTEESIANLKVAIEDVRAYLKDRYSDSELITEKMDSLNSALGGLVEKPVIPEKPEPPVTPEPPVEPEIPLTPLEPSTPIINKSVLMGSIATAEKKMGLTDRYTAESIAQLKPIVDEAKALLYKEDVTQEEIDAMTDKVDQGINNLVEKVVIPMTPLEPSKPIEKPEPPVEPEKPEPPVTPEKPEVNKASLEATIKAADEKVVMTDKYTEESIANLKAVLDEAKALVSDSNASQDMVDEMVRKLNSAMDGMVEKPVEPEKPEIPLTPLEPALPVEPEKPEIPLTPLEPSTPVEKPEKPEVEVVDKADLKDAIEKAEKEAALTTKYTKESIAKLNEVVKEAKAVLDKEDATQKDVDAMVEKVNKAMKDLVLVKPEQKPDDNKKPSTDDKKPANTDKKPADKTTAPKTGDPASAGMLASLFVGSGAAIVAALKKRK